MVVESLQSLYKKSIYIFIINIKEKLIKLITPCPCKIQFYFKTIFLLQRQGDWGLKDFVLLTSGMTVTSVNWKGTLQIMLEFDGKKILGSHMEVLLTSTKVSINKGLLVLEIAPMHGHADRRMQTHTRTHCLWSFHLFTRLYNTRVPAMPHKISRSDCHSSPLTTDSGC